MGLFFIHIIKSSLCLITFYLAYKLLLSKETFYRGNRFILLGIFIASMFIPFIELTINQPEVAVVPVKFKNIEQVLIQKGGHFDTFSTADNIYFLIFCIYLIGAFTQLIISIVNFLRIFRLAKGASHIPFGEYTIAVTEEEQAPFSWGRYIVLSKKEYDRQPEIIIQHELIHLQRLHSLDLLLTEFTIILFWFNPVVRLLTQELKDTHEFEVDDALIRGGVNAKEYQLLLIKKSAGEKMYSIANSFNQSKLSVRIRMMLRQRSNPWAQLKYICIVLLSMFSIVAFARPDVTGKLKELSSDRLKTFIKTQVNNISENLTDDKDKNIAAVKQLDKPAAKPITTAATPVNADQKTDVGEKTKPGHPICIVNGKPMSYADFKQINPDDIKTVKILKEKEAIDTYGEEGKNGAIVITLVKEKSVLAVNGPQTLLSQTLSSINPQLKAIYFVDGAKLNEEEQKAFNIIYASRGQDNIAVESVVMISGKEALNRYGEEGKSGILEVYFKTK